MSWTTLFVNDNNPVKQNIYGNESQFNKNVGIGLPSEPENRITFNGVNGQGIIPHITALDALITDITCDRLTIRGQTGSTGAYYVDTNDTDLSDNYFILGGSTGGAGQTVKVDDSMYHGATGVYIGDSPTNQIITSGTAAVGGGTFATVHMGTYQHAFVKRENLGGVTGYITSGRINSVVENGTGDFTISLGTSGVTYDKIFVSTSVLCDVARGGAINNNAIACPECLDDAVRIRILDTSGTYRNYPWCATISYRCDNL